VKCWNQALLCVLLSVSPSCVNVKDQKVTNENKDKLISETATSKDLTDDERQLLTGYMVRENLSGILQGGKPSIPGGKTVGEMIDDQRRWVARNEEEERGKRKGAKAVGRNCG
jgi:F0F1-type ATP synthase beta subunit